jgi:hypothetical protein
VKWGGPARWRPRVSSWAHEVNDVLSNGRPPRLRALTKEYESSWIFEPCLTCANALRRVQNPGFSLVTERDEST